MALYSCKCNQQEIKRPDGFGTRLVLGAWIEEHQVVFEETAPDVFNGYFLAALKDDPEPAWNPSLRTGSVWIGKHWDGSAVPKFERLTNDGEPSGETRWIRAKDLVFLGMTWDPAWEGIFRAPVKTTIEILPPPAERMLRLGVGGQVLNLTPGEWMELEDDAFEGAGYFLIMKKGSCAVRHHFPVGQVVYGEDVTRYGDSVFTRVNAEGGQDDFALSQIVDGSEVAFLGTEWNPDWHLLAAVAMESSESTEQGQTVEQMHDVDENPPETSIVEAQNPAFSLPDVGMGIERLRAGWDEIGRQLEEQAEHIQRSIDEMMSEIQSHEINGDEVW